MMFNGFRTIAEYESECSKHGFATERVPCQRGDEQFFVLITRPRQGTLSTCIHTWHLFTADESAELLDGVINGVDANYLGKLAAHGFTLKAGNKATCG